MSGVYDADGIDLAQPPLKRKQLHVIYDVTGLPQHEIDGLCGEAEAQAESSSDYTEDEPGTGHRDVPVTSVEVVVPDGDERAALLALVRFLGEHPGALELPMPLHAQVRRALGDDFYTDVER